MNADFAQYSLFHRYVIAVYWSSITATTTGYGDYHAVNKEEMIFTIFYVFLNIGMNSYVIGNMTNLIVQATFKTKKFVSITFEILFFCYGFVSLCASK